jgi:hypothetical protein
MRMFWIAAMTAGLLTMSAPAQTASAGSASGGASVTPGQASAGANASQSTQTPGASTSVDGSANAKAPQSNENKGTDKGSAGSAVAGSAGVNDPSGTLTSGTTLQAELTKSIDAKKAKPGDEVTAKLTQDVVADHKVVMHKGAKLVGHVTEAQARSKDNAESKLGVVFDKAVLKGGQEMAFSGVIQALAPPVQGTLSATGDESGNLGAGMGSGSGSSMGGGLAPMGGTAGSANSTLGSATNAAGNTAGSVTNSATGAVNGSANQVAGAANGTFNSATRGVVGMQGIALNTAAAGSSASRNVKLDSGTQMILQATGSATAR